MTVFVATTMSLMTDSTAIEGWVSKLDIGGVAEAKDGTTFGSGGWKAKYPGLSSFTIAAEGFADFAATGVNAAFPLSGFGGGQVVTMSVPGATAGDLAYFAQGIPSDLLMNAHTVGELDRWAASWSGTAQLVRGSLLHPQAARTASGTGTAVAFTPPTATQSLYASFHVLSVTGAGTLVLKVQTDDNSGFTSATDRITSSSFAAVGRQFTSSAGALAGETHMRVTWTVTGFTSVTFGVAAGVLNT